MTMKTILEMTVESLQKQGFIASICEEMPGYINVQDPWIIRSANGYQLTGYDLVRIHQTQAWKFAIDRT